MNRVFPEIVGVELYPLSSHKDKIPDWTVPTIDQDKGIITLQLRAERSGKGKSRINTVTITGGCVNKLYLGSLMIKIKSGRVRGAGRFVFS